MKLTKAYSWSRRDFYFDAECEHCKTVETKITGYDDANFYNNVIPDMKCKKCEKSTNSLGGTPAKIEPKYDSTLTI